MAEADGLHGEDAAGHLLWSARLRPDGRLGPGVRVFRHGSATAVVSPGLSGRHRIAVDGKAEDALVLVRDEALAATGPGYRPFGDAELIAALVRGTPGLVAAGGPEFLWMETTDPPPDVPDGVAWLDGGGEKEAATVFDDCFPDSYAQPGRPGTRRWAGAHDPHGGGTLLAVAGDAWSGAGCGFMAGVVTRPEARGRGLGAAVSRFVVDALVREHGRAALMVDADNTAAVAAYRRAGMRGREFGAAVARAWGSAEPS
ncbi:GNAT family N-acetyltransferase [Streptomyces sp. NBC_00989]|uniref:GNAT family N-acetyltransferase n=1 Tax=Streptomyces sp. NBC_00989 TaxID=2903705 RepID=UPI00386455A9|nr:GNAT family N-acetyltransferase [Streptomyces sp. NBC_00989]